MANVTIRVSKTHAEWLRQNARQRGLSIVALSQAIHSDWSDTVKDLKIKPNKKKRDILDTGFLKI